MASLAVSASLLTVGEVAGALRKKPAAVRALANRGELSFYRVGRTMLFSPIDLERFLAQHRRPARGEKASAVA
jgi:excisionase family DNA binding protein